MSFDKIEFVKPNDILQGGFNPNLPAEISVQEQLLYSIANNLAILNNNLINSGALQNLALLGDLMQEIFTDDRVADKKTSVLKTADNATYDANQSVFVGRAKHIRSGTLYNGLSFSNIAQTLNNNLREEIGFMTPCVVNQATSTYSFNVPVPSVSVTSSPATVNVNASAPVVNNNIPVPHVTNNVEVAPAVPEITVNSTAPIVNNNVPVPSVTNEIEVQSASPTIEVSATAPVVNVSSSPATVTVNSTAPIVNNNIPVPTVNNTVQSASPTIEVSATAPVVNVSSSPANIDIQPYDDSALIAKIEEMREVLQTSFVKDEKSIIEQALNVNTDDTKMSISEVLLSKDNITFNDVNVESLLDKDIEIKEFLK